MCLLYLYFDSCQWVPNGKVTHCRLYYLIWWLKGLAFFIRKVVQVNLIKVFQIGNNKVSVSYLWFVDDIVLFCLAKKRQVWNPKVVLGCFREKWIFTFLLSSEGSLSQTSVLKIKPFSTNGYGGLVLNIMAFGLRWLWLNILWILHHSFLLPLVLFTSSLKFGGGRGAHLHPFYSWLF